MSERSADELVGAHPSRGQGASPALGPATSEAGGTPTRAAGLGPWLVFIVALALPLYVIAIILCVRSGLLHLGGGRLSDEEIKAVWAFLAAGLGASATTVGALLANSHNKRTVALQEDAEERRGLLERQGHERLKLDTAVSALKLIAGEHGYAEKAVIAGGLTTLVHLEHPVLAMQVMATAKDDGVITPDTFADLLSTVLALRATPQQTMLQVTRAWDAAVDQLEKHAGGLTDPGRPGAFSWPVQFTASWPPGLSRNASQSAMYALIELVLSQEKGWWLGGATYTWVIYTLDEALAVEGADTSSGQLAATLGQFLLDTTEDDASIDGVHDSREQDDVARRMAAVQKWTGPHIERLRARIETWGRIPDGASSLD